MERKNIHQITLLEHHMHTFRTPYAYSCAGVCVHDYFICYHCDCGFVFLVFDLLEIMRALMSEAPEALSTLVDEHHYSMPIFVWYYLT